MGILQLPEPASEASRRGALLSFFSPARNHSVAMQRLLITRAGARAAAGLHTDSGASDVA